jgi:hypothetical protein
VTQLFAKPAWLEDWSGTEEDAECVQRMSL